MVRSGETNRAQIPPRIRRMLISRNGFGPRPAPGTAPWPEFAIGSRVFGSHRDRSIASRSAPSSLIRVPSPASADSHRIRNFHPAGTGRPQSRRTGVVPLTLRRCDPRPLPHQDRTRAKVIPGSVLPTSPQRPGLRALTSEARPGPCFPGPSVFPALHPQRSAAGNDAAHRTGLEFPQEQAEPDIGTSTGFRPLG